MKTKHMKNMLLSLLAGCMLVAGATALTGSSDQVIGSYPPDKYLQQIQLFFSWMQGEKPKAEKTSSRYLSEEDESLKALHELMAQIAICR